MKKVLLLTTALLLVATVAMAQLPPTGYIGLYTDDARSSNCIEATGGGYDVYVMVLPSDQGLMTTEFAISFPSGVYLTKTTYASDIALTWGDPANGLRATFSACKTAWCWPCYMTFDIWNVSGGNIEIIPHPDSGLMQLCNCNEGYPTESVIYLTPMYLGECGPLANEESSWGAIKGMYE